jgi:hypothetical protein
VSYIHTVNFSIEKMYVAGIYLNSIVRASVRYGRETFQYATEKTVVPGFLPRSVLPLLY